MTDDTTTEQKPIEPEVVNETAMDRPQGLVTIEDFASSKEGLERLERGIQIIKTLRRASIALTFPQDWVLNKADNRVVGYLQDTGVQRIWDLWGIEQFNLGDYERIDDKESGDFSISIIGSAFCKRTGQSLEKIAGTRYSYEEFIVKRKLNRLQVEPEVRKAARANLDGNLGRELMGMKNVPVEELDEVWASAGMTWKSSKLCVMAHGYGKSFERQGGSTDEAPTCPKCKAIMRRFTGDYGPYYGCPNYKTCGQKPIKEEAWLKELAKKKPAPTPPADREPGDEAPPPSDEYRPGF